MISNYNENTPDSILVPLAADGDQMAFSVLVRKYAYAMLGYARRFLHDADDVVQEALITAWDSIETLENPNAVKTWLLRITARKALDQLRAQKYSAPLEYATNIASPETGPADSSVSSSNLDALSVVLAKLPESQRNVWLLREAGHLSYAEIAEELHITIPQVRGRLARARTTVIEEMKEWR